MTASQKIDVKALAALARLDIDEGDMKTFEEQIPAILSFAARIQEVVETVEPDMDPAHKNVMREDADAHEPGAYTDDLLAAAPASEKGYVRVTQVLKGGKHS